MDTFSLDPTSGVITVSADGLDREDTELYILMVSASDSGSDVTMTATATVYVNVLDVNDNMPECTPTSAKVEENADPGTLIGNCFLLKVLLPVHVAQRQILLF